MDIYADYKNYRKRVIAAALNLIKFAKNEFNNLSDEDRDLYRSYSGSYTDYVNPLWVRVKEWP